MTRSFEVGVNEMERGSKAPEETKKSDDVPETIIDKKGRLYVLAGHESKTRRVSIALPPSTFKKLKGLAEMRHISYNELINTIIKEYLNI